MRSIDLSSWQTVLSTLLGLAVITLIGVGIRLLVMQTVQKSRERENRQINERLRTLIAAYKILGGSFTGDLAVDPSHRRDWRRSPADAQGAAGTASAASDEPSSDRSRRIRDAVEAALADIILLGTEQQVQLAAAAATELAEGRPVHTAELVISLRDFIRQVLNLDAVPAHLSIPRQGPARPAAKRGGEGGERESAKQGAGKDLGGASGGGGGGGGGGGEGGGGGFGGAASADEESDHHHP
jgi:uncharacterized membrane protein YgcG